MTEALFYELGRQRLEAALAGLLERCLERGWRAVVQATSSERVEALDQHLWSYRDDSFLAHGTAATGHAGLQPVYLCDRADNPNGAVVQFLVDGAEIGDMSGYRRVVYLFNGNDAEERELARARWSAVSAAGHDVTYWKQDEDGRWVKQG
jgi:DNA polymerase-3 subunit chi